MRTNNNNKHISDQASSILFESGNTVFPSEDYSNLQDILEDLGDHARKDSLPQATTEIAGVARTATTTEIDTGTSSDTIVTPQLLAYALDQPNSTELDIGWTRYSTNAEALNTSFETAATTPKNVHHIFENRNATQTLYGTVRLASENQATDGTDNEAAMTSLRVKQAIDALVPSVATADENTIGPVQLATATQTENGTLREGYAVSPFGFANANADTTKFGTTRYATNAQVASLSSTTRSISPAGLGSLSASTTQRGISRFATNAEAAALSSTSVGLTPSGLSNVTADESSAGIIRLANASESIGSNADDVAISPSRLNNRTGTATRRGVLRLSSSTTSTSNTTGGIAATPSAVRSLQLQLNNIDQVSFGWDIYYYNGGNTSSSRTINISRSAINNKEILLVYRGGSNIIYTRRFFYSQAFLDDTGAVLDGGATNIRIDLANERITLPSSGDRFLLIATKDTNLNLSYNAPPPPPPPPPIDPWGGDYDQDIP